jgi:hypothetical protein
LRCFALLFGVIVEIDRIVLAGLFDFFLGLLLIARDVGVALDLVAIVADDGFV